jgi:hypothetical protein
MLNENTKPLVSLPIPKEENHIRHLVQRGDRYFEWFPSIGSSTKIGGEWREIHEQTYKKVLNAKS